MATGAASPVFRLLGAPPVNTGLLDGQLAWRPHDGGHGDRSNMSFFIAWANRLLHHAPPPVPADQPRMRARRNSHLAHQQLRAKATSGGIDLHFEGGLVDGVHLSLKGYEVWAEGLKPILTELLGPPAAADHAPPPTGDPSAGERSGP